MQVGFVIINLNFFSFEYQFKSLELPGSRMFHSKWYPSPHQEMNCRHQNAPVKKQFKKILSFWMGWTSSNRCSVRFFVHLIFISPLDGLQVAYTMINLLWNCMLVKTDCDCCYRILRTFQLFIHFWHHRSSKSDVLHVKDVQTLFKRSMKEASYYGVSLTLWFFNETWLM